MKRENIIIHALWVGDSLSLLEQLTIKLLQKNGHTVHLWCYDDIKNIPQNTVIRNAADILPKNSIFSFQGHPLLGIPNGGIGSLSHWSDQFQMKLLNMEGGIYTQLDVAYLWPLDFKQEYLFVAHMNRSISTFLMKCPRGSIFTSEAYKDLSLKINKNTISKCNWDCSMDLIMEVLRTKTQIPITHPKCFLKQFHFLNIDYQTPNPFFNSFSPPKDLFVIHWSNATVNTLKNKPIKNSYYEFLLKSVDLI